MILSLLTTQNVIHALMWASLIFYWVCFFPQIATNFRVKSGKGVSELMLLGYLNAYLFLLFYIFCMDMPFAYKLMVPLHALSTLVLVLQRLYYDSTPQALYFWFLYGTNVAVFLFVFPYAFHDPVKIGVMFGWCNFVLCVLNQLPQIIKLYQQKSVVGFSFWFVLFTGLAAFVETIVAYAVGLPPQTFFNAIRGVILAAVMGVQFVLYRK
jgi:uncharacterized protein with PQ loop repeat